MFVIVVIVIVLDVVMIAASVVLEGVVTSEITQLQALLSWIFTFTGSIRQSKIKVTNTAVQDTGGAAFALRYEDVTGLE